MYLNEENMMKIDAVHKKEKTIGNIVADILTPIATFGAGFLFAQVLHAKLWNKAGIQYCDDADCPKCSEPEATAELTEGSAE